MTLPTTRRCAVRPTPICSCPLSLNASAVEGMIWRCCQQFVCVREVLDTCVSKLAVSCEAILRGRALAAADLCRK